MAGSKATLILEQIAEGDTAAVDRLLPMVYQELRALAGSYFRQQVASHTLEPTALVHEAFLKLVSTTDIRWEGRSHFFAVAAKAMREILADHARRKRAEKRGGDWQRITLSRLDSDQRHDEIDVLDLDAALKKLAELDERQARIIELRFFGGLTVEEAATVMGISPRTAEYDWRIARAWLRSELQDGFRA